MSSNVNYGEWKYFDKSLPQYYSLVQGVTKEGETLGMWRATDGDECFMTEYTEDEFKDYSRVFKIDELVKWRYLDGSKE